MTVSDDNSGGRQAMVMISAKVITYIGTLAQKKHGNEKVGNDRHDDATTIICSHFAHGGGTSNVPGPRRWSYGSSTNHFGSISKPFSGWTAKPDDARKYISNGKYVVGYSTNWNESQQGVIFAVFQSGRFDTIGF